MTDNNIDIDRFTKNINMDEDYFYSEIQKNPLDGIFTDSPEALFILIHDKTLHDNKILGEALKFEGILKIFKNLGVTKKMNDYPEYKKYYEETLGQKLYVNNHLNIEKLKINLFMRYFLQKIKVEQFLKNLN